MSRLPIQWKTTPCSSGSRCGMLPARNQWSEGSVHLQTDLVLPCANLYSTHHSKHFSQQLLHKVIKPTVRLWTYGLTNISSPIFNFHDPKGTFTPGHMMLDTSCIHLLPSTCFLYRRQNCCQFVACLLLDTKRITCRPWHKWIVTRNKSNASFEPVQYRQDMRHIAHYNNRKNLACIYMLLRKSQ